MKSKRLIPGLGVLLALPQWYLGYSCLADSFEKARALGDILETIQSDPDRYYNTLDGTAQALAHAAEISSFNGTLLLTTGLVTIIAAVGIYRNWYKDGRKLSDIEREIKNTL